jgi:HEAT repeat protein
MNHTQPDNFRNREQVLCTRNSKRTRRAWLGFLIFAACVGGLSLLWVHFRSNAHPAASAGRPEAALRAPSVNTAPSISEASLALQTGDRLVYRFHQHRSLHVEGGSSGELTLNGGAKGSTSLQIKQDGDFVVKVYEETAKGWLVGLSLENAVIETSPKETDAPRPDSGTGLRAEILAFVQKSGKFGKMTSLEQTSEETLVHWRDILGRWQTVLADKLSTRKWNYTEEDATGTYVAEYFKDSDGPPAVLRKTKHQYLSISGTGSNRWQGRSNVSGDAVIHLNPYPTQIEGREQLTLFIPEVGGSFASDATYSFHLQSAAREPEIQAAGAEMARRFETSDSSFAWAVKHEANSTASPVNVDGTTIEEQIDDLIALHEQGLNRTTAELKTLEKIVALVKNDDSAVEAITRHLSQHSGPAEGIPSSLIGMLGAAGTPKAQQALIGLTAANEWPMDQRRMGLFSFVQVTEPVPEVDNWLRQLHQRHDELSNSSLLMLAAMGDRVREQDPQRFQDISQYVVASANAPGLDIQEKLVGLDALGNLGPRDVSEVVREALASEDQLLRTKGVLSLERVVNDTAYRIIQKTLSADSSETVRAAAASLLSDTRRAGGLDDLSFAATHDPSENVRVIAVKSLGEWMGASPEASRLLQQVSDQDSSKDVREVAAQVLRSRTIPEAAGVDAIPQ